MVLMQAHRERELDHGPRLERTSSGPHHPKVWNATRHNGGDRDQASLVMFTRLWGVIIHSPADLQGTKMPGMFVYFLLVVMWHASREYGKRESRIKGPATRSVICPIVSLLNR